MNTDKHRSALLTRKSFASCQGFFSAGLLGAHASCVQGVRHPGHAGSVRSRGRNLRVLCVSAVRFFLGGALLLCVHQLISSRVSRDLSRFASAPSALLSWPFGGLSRGWRDTLPGDSHLISRDVLWTGL